MNNKIKMDEVNSFTLEDWVRVFGNIYSKADADRDASSLWLDVIDKSSNLAEYIRREEYNQALKTLPIVFSHLLRFVAKYSLISKDDLVLKEEIDLRPEGDNSSFITQWVLHKYPGVCSVCAQKPCICPSTRFKRENRNIDFEEDEIISTRFKKYKKWESEIVKDIKSYTLERLFKMFNDIYSGIHYDPPLSSICFHFLEEVGEVARLLISYNNIQILKKKDDDSYEDKLKHLNNDLKNEISDVISWTMALINKINYIFRSTYPHYHCILTKDQAITAYSYITLSELLFDWFYDNKKDDFVCYQCKLKICTTKCKQNHLIKEIEDMMEKEEILMRRLRQSMSMGGNENRRSTRQKTQIKTAIEDQEVCIVDMSNLNLGFLSNKLLSLNEIKSVKLDSNGNSEYYKIKIVRPTNANAKTGYSYFYGAEILERKPK